MFYEKKHWTIGCMLLMLVVLLGACGANQAGPSESAAPQSQPPGEAGESELPAGRYYESAKGTIELPEIPSNVVVAVRDYVGDVLATGLKPVGVSSTMVFDAPYYKELLQGVKGIGEDSAISFETIASLDPDLIFTYQDDAYDNLSKIAPTAFIPYGQHSSEERLLEIGRLLNREAEARERLDRFNRQAEARKEALAGKLTADTKAAIIEITDKELYLFGTTYGRGGEIIYNRLGLSAPQQVEEATKAEGWASISLEVLPDFLGEADYLFLGVRPAGEARKTEIESSPLWTGLPAVQAGNVYEYNLQEFYFQDVLALEYQLDVIADFLESH